MYDPVLKSFFKSADVIDYFIWGIASPVKMDSLATQDPLNSNISHGTVRYDVFYYFFGVVLVNPFGNICMKGSAFAK